MGDKNRAEERTGTGVGPNDTLKKDLDSAAPETNDQSQPNPDTSARRIASERWKIPEEPAAKGGAESSKDPGEGVPDKFLPDPVVADQQDGTGD
jgi:hypothetical protein